MAVQAMGDIINDQRDQKHADQAIQRDIAAAIFEQRLPPGTRLSEARLGELYNVSRTVARKALLRLAGEKLVDIRPNRGAIVAQPSVQEAHDVFEARRMVEIGLLKHALPAMTPKHHLHLRELLEADHQAHAAHDRQRMIHASGDFHLELARPAGNEVLLHFLEQLIRRTSLIIATYETQATTACSDNAHEALINAIEARDVPLAQRLMREHLEDCELQLKLPQPPSQEQDLAQMLGVSISG